MIIDISNTKTLLLLAVAIGVSACGNTQVVSDSPASKSAVESTNEVILTSEIKWEQLNPARGERSPQAGTLWGDRKRSIATGFLVKFVDGFSSPPHIHNVSYRGVVINGLIHNDDPNATQMWMPTGSFWTQPKGELHITAARGKTNVAYIEIEQGPYLVLPKEDAYDSGERPVNVDASNIVWIDATNTNLIDQSTIPISDSGPQLAFLWGKPRDNQIYGALVKLPAGFTGTIDSHGKSFRAVVIKGQLLYQVDNAAVKNLEPGSYFSSKQKSVHQVATKAEQESIIYIRTNGKFSLIPTK